ncbi:hypothetical protein M3Y94_00109100 [Aphelenchoides besseyi]|nr:hypothetical protein M3Y94_00109100 [Aphelenchoides besseyi]KAI6237522.1 hypothetical protein M3Y95_00274000 [Aphelenchoides besseyi]
MSSACNVCQVEGPTAKHFGGKGICRSCKVFFRRCVKSEGIFTCLFENKCVVEKNSRASCRACRLERCITVGMNPNLVHSDRKPQAQRQLAAPDDTSDSIIFDFDSPNEKKLVMCKKTTKEQLDLIIESSKRTLLENNCALGVMKLIDFPNKNDPISVVSYLQSIDLLLDTYYEDIPDAQHLFNLNQPLEVAFLLEPRKLCRRSKILWEPLYPFCEATEKSFKGIWCRTAIHFIDWVSHLPEFQQLKPVDQFKMLINRQSSISAMSIAHRTIKFGRNRCVLMSGGCYFELKDEEESTSSENKDEPLDLTTQYVVEAGRYMYDAFADPARELKVTDEEMVLLRTIAFFQPVARLTLEGRSIVLAAQTYYCEILAETIKQNESNTMAACKRMTALLSLIPPVEYASIIEDQFMTLATLFNAGEMQGDLTVDLYIKRRR